MNQPDVSIVVPTRNRPQDLRRALRSIARQEAIGAIAEVLVIENGAVTESRAVCDEFPDIPVVWLLNDPPVPMTAWTNRVFRSPSKETEYFALLCDDDWWEPTHLARALSVLRTQPACGATWSGCIEYDAGAHTAMPRGHTIWALCQYASDAVSVALSIEDVLAAHLMTTAFHISSMVARRTVLDKALPEVANGNPFDIDRHLACRMAVDGTTVYFPSPSVGVASHGDRESITLGRTAEARTWWKRTTQEIVALAKGAEVDLAAYWDQIIVRSPADVPTLLSHAYFDGAHAVAEVLPMSGRFVAASQRLRLAMRLQRFLPPAILSLLGLRKWLARNLPQPVLA
jgi:glycosyltransferase involved in cell wall biosynthesis